MNLIISAIYFDCYTSPVNRDLMVYHEGQYKTGYVYGINGKLSQVTTHLEGEMNPLTARTALGAELLDEQGRPLSPRMIDTRPGALDANVLSDLAVGIGKLFFHNNRLGSTDFISDASGNVLAWAEFDAWGVVRAGQSHDLNLAGLTSSAGFTTYTYDRILDLHFAQFRFYDANDKRFTAEDPVKDGANWYSYCGGNPVGFVDPLGLVPTYIYVSSNDGTRNQRITDYYAGSKGLMANLNQIINAYGGSVSTNQAEDKISISFQYATDLYSILVEGSNGGGETSIQYLANGKVLQTVYFEQVGGNCIYIDYDEFHTTIGAYLYKYRNKVYTTNDFYTEMDVLKNLAEQYLGKKASQENVNTLMLQFLRNIPRYTTATWNQFAGGIDQKFIDYVRKNNPALNLDGNLILSQGFNSIDVQHMAATMNGYVHEVPFLDDGILDNLGGWAGDMQSTIGEIQADLSNAWKMGTYESANFGRDDFLADIDAVNLINLMNGGSSFVDALDAYYIQSGSANRFHDFATSVFGSTDKDTIRAVVQTYADYNGWINGQIMRNGSNGEITQTHRDAMADGFVELLWRYIK